MRSRDGVTLVELLIVLAIIGILVALLLPAVQYARESARRAHCGNNLRQLGLAWHEHHDVHRHLPTGGWGYDWVGDPRAGYGRQQPGGWAYAVLEHIEQGNIRHNPQGLIDKPIGLFHCPSLRLPRPYPITRQPRNAPPSPLGAKCDYAANAGDGLDEQGSGSPWERPIPTTGVVGVKSQIELAQVLDGLSNTLMLGEKFVETVNLHNGAALHDNENLYTGLNNDICRSTKLPPRTRPYTGWPAVFGSYHPGGLNAGYCDGSVQHVAYEIDARVWRHLGHKGPQ